MNNPTVNTAHLTELSHTPPPAALRKPVRRSSLTAYDVDDALDAHSVGLERGSAFTVRLPLAGQGEAGGQRPTAQ